MENKRRRGDRWDGTRIRGLDGVHAMMPFLFPNRCDSEVYLYETIDVTDLMEELERVKGENPDAKVTPFHYFIAALAKTLYHRPYLNRFVAGRRYYQRKKLTFAFMVKRFFQDEAQEMIMVLDVSGDMTIKDLQQKIAGEVEEMRDHGKTDVDGLLDFLCKMPRFVMRFIMTVFRFLDFHGWMPKSICNSDTNYASVLVSNLGSIKCDACYHHLNNYGTNSIMITIGNVHRIPVVDTTGHITPRWVVNFGITLDERIADGFYFARSVKLLKYLIANPKLLEAPIKEAVDYDE